MADIKIALVADDDNPNVGDIYLENGTARLTSTLLEEVAQRLFISLKMFKGEWFLDPDQGIPYWQSILGQRIPLSVMSGIFRRAIQLQPGVKAITKLTVVQNTDRSVQLDFACTLTDGTILRSVDFQPFIIGAV
jgi:hypothetical protein